MYTGLSVYKASIISTIVDAPVIMYPRRVYKASIISTIVDVEIIFSIKGEVYKASIISTIVDIILRCECHVGL